MIFKAKTLRGEENIRRWGNEWYLEEQADSVHFAQRPGPWGLFFPRKGGKEHARWIHLVNDQDFEIIG